MKINNILLSAFSIFTFGAVTTASPLLSIGDHADLFFELSGSVAYTDNLTLDENDTIDDVRFVVDPGLALEFGRGLTNVNAMLNVRNNITRYVDNTEFDADLWNITASGNYRSPRVSIGGSAGYVEKQQNQSDVNAQRTLITQERLFGEGDLRYTLSQKTKLGVGGAVSDTSYDGGNNLERTTYTVPVNFFYELTPKLDATAGFRYRLTDVDGGVNTDDYFYNLGLVGDLTQKFSTTFRVGYQDRKFDSDRKSDGTLSLISTSDYDFSPKSTFRLLLDRDFATGGSGSTIERTSARLTWFYLFTPRLNGNLTGSYTLSDYVGSFREDDTYMARVGGQYMLNEYWNLDAFYIFRDNDSNAALQSFTENFFQVGASLRY